MEDQIQVTKKDPDSISWTVIKGKTDFSISPYISFSNKFSSGNEKAVFRTKTAVYNQVKLFMNKQNFLSDASFRFQLISETTQLPIAPVQEAETQKVINGVKNQFLIRSTGITLGKHTTEKHFLKICTFKRSLIQNLKRKRQALNISSPTPTSILVWNNFLANKVQCSLERVGT